MQEAEWQTRKQRIDRRLRGLNPPWQIIRYRAGLDVARLTRHAVTEFPTDNGPANYRLFVSGRFLGVIEAKKVAVNPQIGSAPARRVQVRVPKSAKGLPVARHAKVQRSHHHRIGEVRMLAQQASGRAPIPRLRSAAERDAVAPDADPPRPGLDLGL